MTLLQGTRWSCALLLLAWAGTARAGWEGGVFQVCCDHCGHAAVSAYPPVVTAGYYSQRCYYHPEPECRCGPVRRLLRRVFHPCCPTPTVSSYAVTVTPPCAVPQAIAVPVPAGPPIAPVPVPISPRTEVPPPVPPVSGSSLRRPAPTPAPVPPQPITPPVAPRPVRFESFVSKPAGQVEAVPAVRTREVNPRD